MPFPLCCHSDLDDCLRKRVESCLWTFSRGLPSVQPCTQDRLIDSSIGACSPLDEPSQVQGWGLEKCRPLAFPSVPDLLKTRFKSWEGCGLGSSNSPSGKGPGGQRAEHLGSRTSSCRKLSTEPSSTKGRGFGGSCGALEGAPCEITASSGPGAACLATTASHSLAVRGEQKTNTPKITMHNSE